MRSYRPSQGHVIVLFAFVAVSFISFMWYRDYSDERDFLAYLDRLAASPEMQRARLSQIPMERTFTQQQMRSHLLLSIGYTVDLDSLQEIRVRPGPPNSDGQEFVFRSKDELGLTSIWWERIQ